MNILNIHSCTLRTRAYVNATDAQQSTWLNLTMYCVTQENGGKIPAAASWSDMEWLLATGKHKTHVEESCGLWRFTEAGDCVVEFYPVEQEEKHKAKREGGIEGNRRKYAKKSAPLDTRTASNSATDSESDSESETVGVMATDSESLSVKEGKGKEGKGMEENGTRANDDSSNDGEKVVRDDLPDSGKEETDAATEANFAEWPTREEWLSAADLQGLPRELALREWNNQERKAPDQRWRNIDRRRLQHHAAFVLDCARQRGEVGLQKKNPRPPTATGGTGNTAAMAAMAAMSANLNAASEYPASLVEAVKP